MKRPIQGITGLLMAFLDIKHLDKVKPHPNSNIVESYFFHMVFAWRLALGLAYLSVVGLIHGVIPIIFTDTVSTHVTKLKEILEE